MKRPRIAVTTGDPFGVGPEVCRKALVGFDAEVTIYGDALDSGDSLDSSDSSDAPVMRGPSAEGGRASIAALEAAIAAMKAGAHDALVTAPISKESWSLAGGTAEGHTPYLGRAFGVPEPLMTFAWDEEEPLVALLTHHIPLRAVASTLTSDRIEAAIRVLAEALKGPFARGRSRIGVLGLNPHAGEGGLLGTEESDFVAPALERLAKEGLDLEGPLPADTAFARGRRRFGAILALYHDQGLGPVKALAFDRAVNITLGLPVVRTSPCHGTAFDIAGQDRADPSSMRAALEWAARLAR